ncbi:MAG: hypothetical protein Q8T09_00925 [Candidatus Melainabacteria bacterium]|nr:hypothetical protein [Candidatus Melainabacteria bacterium]
MNITPIIMALLAFIALLFISKALFSGMQRRSRAVKFSRANAITLLHLQPKRIFDTVHQCAQYLSIPPERVLDLNVLIEMEDPELPVYGRYIPSNVMITTKLQMATRHLQDAHAALIDNDMELVWQYLESIDRTLGYAVRGKVLRDAETAALAETQKALQAVQE